jgi:hypothetical protein
MVGATATPMTPSVIIDRWQIVSFAHTTVMIDLWFEKSSSRKRQHFLKDYGDVSRCGLGRNWLPVLLGARAARQCTIPDSLGEGGRHTRPVVRRHVDQRRG